MAKFESEGLDDLMKNLSLLEVERIAPMMLEEAVPILEGAVKSRAAAHKRSGNMYQSIKKTKAKRDGSGHSICVRPTGEDAKGIRNMEKMAYLEYGTSKQAVTPVILPAVRESEESVCSKMQEVFDREVGKMV